MGQFKSCPRKILLVKGPLATEHTTSTFQNDKLENKLLQESREKMEFVTTICYLYIVYYCLSITLI